jgi:CheY-like chemotaxis protein
VPPPHRILVVDDSAEIRALAGAALRHLPGIEILEADGGAAALRWVGTVPVALVLTDLQMPGVDGFELIRRLRADPARRGLPIVAMSADANNLACADELGADATIAKPFRADVIKSLVAGLLPPG